MTQQKEIIEDGITPANGMLEELEELRSFKNKALKVLRAIHESGLSVPDYEFIFTKKEDPHDLEYSDQGGYTVSIEHCYKDEIIDDRTYYNTAPDIEIAKFIVTCANVRSSIKELIK